MRLILMIFLRNHSIESVWIEFDTVFATDAAACVHIRLSTPNLECPFSASKRKGVKFSFNSRNSISIALPTSLPSPLSSSSLTPIRQYSHSRNFHSFHSKWISICEKSQPSPFWSRNLNSKRMRNSAILTSNSPLGS